MGKVPPQRGVGKSTQGHAVYKRLPRMQEVFGMSFGSQEVLQASSVREASEGVGGVGGARRV